MGNSYLGGEASDITAMAELGQWGEGACKSPIPLLPSKYSHSLLVFWAPFCFLLCPLSAFSPRECQVRYNQALLYGHMENSPDLQLTALWPFTTRVLQGLPLQ